MNSGQFNVKIVLDVTVTKYGEHCSSAANVGEAVIDYCAPVSMPLDRMNRLCI